MGFEGRESTENPSRVRPGPAHWAGVNLPVEGIGQRGRSEHVGGVCECTHVVVGHDLLAGCHGERTAGCRKAVARSGAEDDRTAGVVDGDRIGAE